MTNSLAIPWLTALQTNHRQILDVITPTNSTGRLSVKGHVLVCQVAHKIYTCCYGALFHEACRRRRWPWHQWHVSTKVTMAAPSCFSSPVFGDSLSQRLLGDFKWWIIAQSSYCAVVLFTSTSRFRDHLSEQYSPKAPFRCCPQYPCSPHCRPGHQGVMLSMRITCKTTSVEQ